MKQKKLHLLRPQEKIIFLEEGRGQRGTYLEIPKNPPINCLAEDVASGAKCMEKLSQLLERCGTNLSRVLVLRGTNEEILKLAATYAAMQCNQNAIIDSYDYEEDDMYYTEARERFEEADDMVTEGDRDEDESAPSEYRESAFKLPLIEMQELASYSVDGYDVFGDEFLSMGSHRNRNSRPYWMECHKEPVAIIIRKHQFYHTGDRKLLERFQHNRQVFLLVLEHENEQGLSLTFENREELDSLYERMWEQQVMQLLLETVADIAWIGTGVKESVKYQKQVFENIVDRLGYRLTDRFPVGEIVKKITLLQNSNKAELMENVVRYAIKERRKPNTIALTEADFALLDGFQAVSQEKDKKQKSVLELMEKELVGMDNVKKQVRSIVQTMKYVKYREKMGLGKGSVHNVYLLIGAPGTAKSTIGKIIGDALFQEKLLPGNQFISINGASLKAKYVGHTAARVRALFEQYDVILIDEAYSLASKQGGEMDSFGQEALAQLVLELEEHCTDKVVLFAGYGGTGVMSKDNKMKEFIDGNPGLKSRVNSTIFFESYQPEEMVQIVHNKAKQLKFTISHEADERIRAYFEKRMKASDFGNGREARSLVENAFRYSAERVMKVPENKRTKKMMSELSAEDILRAIESLENDNLMQQGRQRTVCGF